MPSTKNITPDENIMGFHVSTKNTVIFQKRSYNWPGM